jgi:ankyrin repeat/BTB/POZ domain-containing protein 1
LNDRIRNLLLQYEYSKSSDPLQPLASHVTSLLSRDQPRTSDITISTLDKDFHLHKFILSARSPYFQKKLAASPETSTWKVPGSVRSEALEIIIRYIYLAEIPVDLSHFGSDEEEILAGINKISNHMEISELFDMIVEAGDRRILRQKRQDEVKKGRDQLDKWFKDNVLEHKLSVDTDKADNVRWNFQNTLFADVLLRADGDEDEETDISTQKASDSNPVQSTQGPLNGIPIGPVLHSAPLPSTRRATRTVLIPTHRAMLIRSEVFLTMFSSSFKESRRKEYLQIVSVDCSPEVLEIILTFLYTERVDFPLEFALDVLFTADELFLEKLKVKSSSLISTLGNGAVGIKVHNENEEQTADQEEEAINIYDVLRAGWITRVHRLEEFAARYLAYRLEDYIDEEDFADIIRESASRITARQETDSIELLDE